MERPCNLQGRFLFCNYLYLSNVKSQSVFIILLCVSYVSLKGQTQYNTTLKRQLDSILIEDQKYRPVFIALLDSIKTDSLVSFHKMPAGKIDSLYSYLTEQLDASNLHFIENAISKYGYAGKSMVGEPTNKAMWYIIQHSDKISQYFNVIEKAGKEKELPMQLVATMQDRLLVEQNKRQIYGTQIARRKLRNEKEETVFVWTIKNPLFVNHRRKKAGFDTTVQQNAKRFHIKYKRVTLKDIQPLN